MVLVEVDDVFDRQIVYRFNQLCLYQWNSHLFHCLSHESLVLAWETVFDVQEANFVLAMGKDRVELLEDFRVFVQLWLLQSA